MFNRVELKIAFYIVFACWIFFIVYWTMAGRTAKPAAETKRKFKGFRINAGRILFILLFIASFGKYSFYPFSYPIFPGAHIWIITGTVTVMLGLIVAFIARRTLSKNWSSDIDIKQEHELITTGVYGYVRHPIYTGILLMAAGTVIYTDRIGMVIFFLILLSFFLFKSKEEEEILTKHFGEEYSAYKKRVKKIIPYIY